MHGMTWVIWAVWHYPLFHIPGISQYGLNFWIFSVYALILQHPAGMAVWTHAEHSTGGLRSYADEYFSNH